MRAAAIRFAPLLALVALLAGARAQDEGEWEPYAAIAWGMSGHAFLNDWYVLNKIESVADETEASARHYYDRASLASNAFEGAGGTIRVWEKILFEGITRSYEEVRARRQEPQPGNVNPTSRTSSATTRSGDQRRPERHHGAMAHGQPPRQRGADPGAVHVRSRYAAT